MKIVREKPDPSWMRHYDIPVRDNETLGAYKDWSFELWQVLQQVNVDQAAEREFYDEPQTD